MKKTRYLLLLIVIALLTSCARTTPIEQFKKEFAQYPEYSILLQDMKKTGVFFKDYHHQYKIVYAVDSLVFNNYVSDWYEVSSKVYRKYENLLGMIIVAKTKDGKISEVGSPPGYHYVGNRHYGRWRRDSSGNSFWEFYGKYAMLSTAFGMFNRPVYRNDWNTYSDYSRRGQPYFGSKNQYGTHGSYTQQTNKTFFERKKQTELAKKRSFSQKVKQRSSRSNMSRTRSGSGRSGK